MGIPNYIAELRKHVGTDLLWLSGVSVVIANDDGEVLLARRSDNRLWAVVSGILEPGEEPSCAAQREVLEEIGVRVALDRITSVDVTPVVTYSNGDQCQYLDICFSAKIVDGTPHVADDENIEVRWFSVNALPDDMTETSRDRIAHALAQRPEAWFAR
ncbi:NUDIX domain-containing protein [Hoyosella rhizosphaerae]|uniref:NUDIX hydrolase n=1 Tax=Hoyosella rhizosphaerae TaxID=1755582 RepID=A0A916UDQ9_9ACTN|nr:NUDIX domain-containing protein [Hoyosella rhizosphaerae]MBN4925874.1 NUDIX domain-containing protein [Hoyosella rhizosphaerae]GGC67279.1 NUDIX hydrolase [Hoyosella rhizosphaerae]